MIEYYGAARGSQAFYEMSDWCNQQFKNFDYEFPFFFFYDEKEYVAFILKWG